MSISKTPYHKLMSAEEAMSLVQSGDRVYIHSGCAEPERLVKALIQRRQELYGVEIVHLLTLGNADYVLPEMARTSATMPSLSVRTSVTRSTPAEPTLPDLPF